MNDKSYGTVTVRRLRTGDNISIGFSVDKPLVIFYKKDSTTSQVTTDWTSDNYANAPTITPNVSSQRGRILTLANHTWKLDGTTLAFTGATSGDWRTDSTGKFMLNTQTGALKCINANLFTGSNYHNLMLAYSVNVTPQGSSTSTNITKTIEVEVLDQGSNAYWGGITASGSTVLGANNDDVTLTPVLYYQGSAVASDGFTVQWFINGTQITTSQQDASGNNMWILSGKNLTVYRAGVSGMAHIVAKFFVNGGEVEGAGITVRDDSDAVQVIVPDEVTVEELGTLTLTPRLYNQDLKQYITSNVSWAVEVRNNYSEEVVPQTETTEGGTVTNYTINSSTGEFTMDEQRMYYNKDGVSSEYSPIITFEATFG